MLIGVPGSGKSTWISKQNFDMSNTVVLSTDNIIEREAAKMGLTYSQAFGKVKNANGEMIRDLKAAIKAGKNIVWDQTNLTEKNRKGKLSQLTDDYIKHAVFFPTPDEDELKKRLNSRPGKFIPPNIMTAMKSQLEEPSVNEGFEVVIRYLPE